MNSKRIARHRAFFLVISCFLAAQLSAGEIVVKITGISESSGQIGCALFKSADGFPMNNAVAQQLWQPANLGGVTCRFADVPDGSYAASVSHDLNGNRKVDTNFLGIPTEAWGVSNNTRPLMRAPRFDEALFKMKEGKDLTIEIRVDK